ncbi:hypothetical protein [Chondromyces crocatus]|uniref:Uncharacterized protein n=1 Tax=Chondromyces crocatus TaxID=52 RepID=A0A0K1ER46_CHOCO|nr:hypothetical protein [Chondromyces crocatus]AKT43321.1 uncharacterized protein CMC5_075530 [Chondromyces crocatus]
MGLTGSGGAQVGWDERWLGVRGSPSLMATGGGLAGHSLMAGGSARAQTAGGGVVGGPLGGDGVAPSDEGATTGWRPLSATASSVTPSMTPTHPSQLSGPRRGLAIGTSFVPGLVVHGTGHFVAGHRSTGWKLLAMEGAGALGVVGGFAALAATGASRRIVAPVTSVIVASAGLFVISGLADIYGVLAPEGGTGSPPSVLPWVETQVGLRYVYDPVFSYRALSVIGADVRVGGLRLNPSGWFALDDPNKRLRMLAGYRFLGPRTPKKGQERPLGRGDGSFLEMEGAVTHHRYGSEHFEVTTGELSLQGRLDLHHIGPTLRGSFAELGGGMALENYAFTRSTEANMLLLMRFAFGMYLGHTGYPRGEAQVFYDHRHDGYVGGLKMTGLGSGVPGHFGAEGRIYLSPQWGLLLDAQVGSAYMGGLSVLFRHGGKP